MARPDVSMSREEIDAFLSVPRVGVLATVGGDGWPHLSGMWFVPSGSSLRMWTYGKSQKAVNARRDQRATLLVEQGIAYRELKGVSLRGSLLVVDRYDDVRAIGIELYERYTEPELGIPVADGPLVEIERQAHKRVGLILEVERVASWDHSKLS